MTERAYRQMAGARIAEQAARAVRAWSRALAWLGVLLLSAGAGVASAHAPEHLFQVTATIQELMDSVIDPAADNIWDSVATVETAQGTQEHQPRTDEEWQALRRQVITLVEGTNLLVIPGRKLSAGYIASEGAGVSDSKEVQRAIDARPARFVELAHQLHEAASTALRAVDAKDAKALLVAGGRIDAACELCHSTFWYPNQHIPGAPRRR